MKKYLVLVLIISFALLGIIRFEKTFEGAGDDGGYDIIQTSDGGYLLTGWLENFENDSNGVKQAIIIKTDSLGNELWRHIYCDSEGYAQGLRVRESVNDDYYLLTSNTETAFIQFDKFGNELNIYIRDGLRDFDFTHDGGLVFASYSTEWEYPNYTYIHILKVDSLLNLEWDSAVGLGFPRKIICTSDNNYVVTGSNKYLGSGEYDNAKFIKADKNGNMTWSKEFWWWTTGLNYGFGIQETSSLNYIFTATSYLNNTTTLFNYNTNGDQIWSREFSNSGAYSLDTTSDLGYVFPNQNFIIKTDSLGFEGWKSPFEKCFIYAIRQTGDGGYIATGTKINEDGNKDILLLKTNENGLTSIEDEQNIINRFDLLQNYPNPFNPTTDISFSINQKSHVELSVFNSKGEFIRVLFEGMKDIGMHTVSFDASGFNSGLYFYKLTSEGTTKTRKMLFLK